MYSIQNLASKPAESTITVKVQVLQLLLIELIVSIWPCKIIQTTISFEKIIRSYIPAFVLVYKMPIKGQLDDCKEVKYVFTI